MQDPSHRDATIHGPSEASAALDSSPEGKARRRVQRRRRALQGLTQEEQELLASVLDAVPSGPESEALADREAPVQAGDPVSMPDEDRRDTAEEAEPGPPEAPAPETRFHPEPETEEPRASDRPAAAPRRSSRDGDSFWSFGGSSAQGADSRPMDSDGFRW